LTISYRLQKAPANAGGLSYPAETVLIDRFDGSVRIVEEPAVPMKPMP
jgi:hypothetical protein